MRDVVGLREGHVDFEVRLKLDDDNEIVAVITRDSAEALGLMDDPLLDLHAQVTLEIDVARKVFILTFSGAMSIYGLGTVGAALSIPTLHCELIADNIHVHPEVQRILIEVKKIRANAAFCSTTKY